MNKAFDGINVLRWHYGMIGQPRTFREPNLEPLERAFGLALGTSDPADFECLCPVLIFNLWKPELLTEATPEHLRGRLRLAAGIGLFYTDVSRLGMPWPMETTVALKKLAELTRTYHLSCDPWNDPEGSQQPEGLYLEFFKPYGLCINWPLADFLKQYKWTQIRNEKRIGQMIEAFAAEQSVV